MAQQFFYDEQIRRFLLQFTRMFSGFQVQYGTDDLGNPTYLTVPIRYGDSSRQVQAILQQNSANSLPSTPLMTFYVTGLEYARDRVQEPYHVNTVHVRQRTWDPTTETYETTQGNAFSIQRLMPAPYTLKVKLDIWTSNTNQKLQLLEQILWLFNPSMEIQSTDNYIDWTSLSVVELERTEWSNRTVGAGSPDEIDIASLSFVIPIWITPPAKVTKAGVVERIISSVFDANNDALNALESDDLLLGTRRRVTPFGYQLLLLGNQVQILPQEALVTGDTLSTNPTPSTSTTVWDPIINMYGVFRNGISQLRFEINGYEIVGTIARHPTDDKFVIIDIDTDTIPSNTITAVNSVVDPLVKGPGSGLPAAASGQRYLLLNSIGGATDDANAADAWLGTDGSELVANADDIVEYNGTKWTVSFDASATTTTEYVTNATSSIQYRWTGETWIKSYDGLYAGGTWSLVL